MRGGGGGEVEVERGRPEDSGVTLKHSEGILSELSVSRWSQMLLTPRSKCSNRLQPQPTQTNIQTNKQMTIETETVLCMYLML